MRILFVVPYTPNPIRTRPYNLIRHLAMRGHDVTVLTIVENVDDVADTQALEYLQDLAEFVVVRER
jgi:hypothetical protein